MSQLASKEQLRMSFARWVLFTVPLIVFLGFFSGQLSNSGYGNRWFAALEKPLWFPPAWAFPVAWTILYCLLGISLAMILHARGAKGRSTAIGVFALQMVLNLLWSPIFFAAHQVSVALIEMLFLLGAAIATYFVFKPIRKTAALLILPYILWLCFATVLNFELDRLNPAAETMVPDAQRTEIIL
jgi:translocator protein